MSTLHDIEPVIKQPLNLGLGVITSSALEFSEAGDYSAPHGLLDLRSSIAERHGQDVENVCITSGASMGLAAAIAQLPPQSDILCPKPYYLAYPSLIKALGHRPIFYNASPEFVYDTPVLSESLLTKDTRCLIINNPSNPTGRILPNSYFDPIAQALQQRNIQIINDRVSSEFVYDSRVVPDIREILPDGNVITIQSFSKSFGLPGLRVGYITASAKTVQSITHAHWRLTLGASVISQQEVLRILEREGWQRPAALLPDLTKRRRLAKSILGSRMSVPEGGIFALVKTPAADSRKICDYLATKHSVITTPGHIFGVPAALRISLGVSEQVLETALNHVLRTLNEIQAKTMHD